MLILTASVLASFLQNQITQYFSENLRHKLMQKIEDVTAEINTLTSAIVEIDSSQTNALECWNDDPSILENSLSKLRQLRAETADVAVKERINRLIPRLESLLSVLESFFGNRKVGLEDWEENKAYLEMTRDALERLGDKILTSDEVINYLNMSPIITTEAGNFKEFARGVNEEGQSFTRIFYLLRGNETSCFHQLRDAKNPRLSPDEKWTWLGNAPLSLFRIVGEKLIEVVLDEDSEEFTVVGNTWFAASVKENEDHTGTDSQTFEAPFSLVVCACTPAFVVSVYNDDFMGDKELNVKKIANTEYKIKTIRQLLHGEQQKRFDEIFPEE